MRIYIVIPAHNEAEFLRGTLESLIRQSRLPEKLVVVDDMSTDKTASIAEEFARKNDFISVIKTSSSGEHLPGSKVINAFYAGYNSLDEDYDIICKFDADLIFPPDYLKTIQDHFKEDPRTGMAGGFCVIQKENKWLLENLTDKDHIRGALKSYRKECFLQIGGLQPAMGWDTVDELLAQYHGWRIRTDASLLVKHLKPTGKTYNPSSKYRQGEAFYRLRYGWLISLIASAKLAFLKKDLSLFRDYISGYQKARKEKQPFLVSREEGRFIRDLRWRKMRRKLLK